MTSLVCCLITLAGWCQYRGGAGDGYDAAELSVSVTSVGQVVQHPFEAAVVPNPSTQGQAARLATEAVLEHVRVFAVSGSLLWQVARPTSGRLLNLPEDLGPGLYLVELRSRNGAVRTLRWTQTH